MIWLLIGLLFLGALFNFACAANGAMKLKNSPLERHVRIALVFCGCAIATYGVGILMRTELTALFVYGIYHIFADLTVVTMLRFIMHYVGTKKKLTWQKVAILCGIIVDTACLLVNPFLQFMYNVDMYNGRWHHIHDYKWGYWIHGIFLLILITWAIILLAVKTIRVPKAYAVRYFSVGIALLIIIMTNLFHIGFGLKFDYSLLFYPITCYFIFYYSMQYIPGSLINRLLILSFSSMKDGVICLDIDRKIVHSNKAALDYAEADVDIHSLEEQVRKWQLENLEPGASQATWDDIRRVDGKEHYFNIEFRRIYDTSDKYLGAFYLIHDKTEEYTKLYTERYRATHDQLTGLYNKERFYELARKTIDESPDTDYMIIVTDIKNFKLVNDVFGVEMGDAMLKRVAQITAHVGSTDCVYARLTNDHFAICMPKERFSEDELLCSYSVVDSFLENAAFKTHIHIGVYEIKDRSTRVSVMCDRANIAIKSIKQSFSSYVSYYDEEIRRNFIMEHKLVSEFEKAITGGQLHAYIQPQIAVDGSILGGEALVRWIHPKDGVIPPDKYIPIFEQTGLIGRLDKLMWEIACIYLKRWSGNGLEHTYISVNISQKDFYLMDVFQVMTDLVHKYDIDPQRLHLEITETAIMNDPEEQKDLLRRFRETGFVVEIDDFGSGYSSLNMLRELEVDVLKIDMGFLKKTEHTDRSKKILRSIMSLAKVLEMEIITEGVENWEQVEFLAEYGCDLFQGYYFAKPVSVEEFEKSYLNKRYKMEERLYSMRNYDYGAKPIKRR